MISIEPNECNLFNSKNWSYTVDNNILVLFPSWLEHSVGPNKKATRNRISLSFNTFAKGFFGDKGGSAELIL